jgi:hypothetical protein
MAAGPDYGYSEQIRRLVDAVDTLNTQIARLVDLVQNFSTKTNVALGIIALLALVVGAVAFFGPRLFDHYLKNALQRSQSDLKRQEDELNNNFKLRQDELNSNFKVQQDELNNSFKLRQDGFAAVIRQIERGQQASLDHLRDMSQSFLRTAESVDIDLRTRRYKAYRMLWYMTRILPAWPRELVRYSELGRLSQRMRRWYFTGGGLYLSSEAMARYRMVQDALKVFPWEGNDEVLDDNEYEDLRGHYLSRLRTALTFDLLSRSAPFEALQTAEPLEVDSARIDSSSVDGPGADVEHDKQTSVIVGVDGLRN